MNGAFLESSDSTNSLDDPMHAQSSYKYALEDRVYDEANSASQKLRLPNMHSGNAIAPQLNMQFLLWKINSNL
jgi:hypothetical protein